MFCANSCHYCKVSKNGSIMRIEQQEFQEWNMVVAMLVQVTCGRISRNMRRIGLRRENGDWIIEFIIAEDNAQDREDAEDIASEL